MATRNEIIWNPVPVRGGGRGGYEEGRSGGFGARFAQAVGDVLTGMDQMRESNADKQMARAIYENLNSENYDPNMSLVENLGRMSQYASADAWNRATAISQQAPQHRLNVRQAQGILETDRNINNNPEAYNQLLNAATGSETADVWNNPDYQNLSATQRSLLDERVRGERQARNEFLGTNLNLESQNQGMQQASAIEQQFGDRINQLRGASETWRRDNPAGYTQEVDSLVRDMTEWGNQNNVNPRVLGSMLDSLSVGREQGANNVMNQMQMNEGFLDQSAQTQANAYLTRLLQSTGGDLEEARIQFEQDIPNMDSRSYSAITSAMDRLLPGSRNAELSTSSLVPGNVDSSIDVFVPSESSGLPGYIESGVNLQTQRPSATNAEDFYKVLPNNTMLTVQRRESATNPFVRNTVPEVTLDSILRKLDISGDFISTENTNLSSNPTLALGQIAESIRGLDKAAKDKIQHSVDWTRIAGGTPEEKLQQTLSALSVLSVNDPVVSEVLYGSRNPPELLREIWDQRNYATPSRNPGFNTSHQGFRTTYRNTDVSRIAETMFGTNDVTELTLGQVSSSIQPALRNATQATGKPSSAIGIGQFLQSTISGVGKNLFGDAWESTKFTPEVQFKLMQRVVEENKDKSNSHFANTIFAGLGAKGINMNSPTWKNRRSELTYEMARDIIGAETGQNINDIISRDAFNRIMGESPQAIAQRNQGTNTVTDNETIRRNTETMVQREQAPFSIHPEYQNWSIPDKMGYLQNAHSRVNQALSRDIDGRSSSLLTSMVMGSRDRRPMMDILRSEEGLDFNKFLDPDKGTLQRDFIEDSNKVKEGYLKRYPGRPPLTDAQTLQIMRQIGYTYDTNFFGKSMSERIVDQMYKLNAEGAVDNYSDLNLYVTQASAQAETQYEELMQNMERLRVLEEQSQHLPKPPRRLQTLRESVRALEDRYSKLISNLAQVNQVPINNVVVRPR